ncbi:unnamed protein product [Leptidea sinapis]|uniref:DNA replication factor RFC1 C-terminal domain-containing protein n=1 Tax=Leptidea sinapis TaxID=189913 RepID=A0A5E4QKQ7_9NEOP|nr:unnamed protein product [Leptidea sinapis]
MSRNIRSYFTVQKRETKVKEEDSDEIPESPDVQIVNKKKQSRKKRQIEDSDEEILTPKKKKTDTTPQSKHQKSPKALKEVTITDLFGAGKIKKTEALVIKDKKGKKTETGIHSDDEFEKSLLELDENKVQDLNKSQIESLSGKEKINDKSHEIENKSKKSHRNETDKEVVEEKKLDTIKSNNKSNCGLDVLNNQEKSRDLKNKIHSDPRTEKKLDKLKLESKKTESSKNESKCNYSEFLSNDDSKDSDDRKRKHNTSLNESGNVTHVLVGDDAGPAKTAKAQELGIKIISEDDFLKMISESLVKKVKVEPKPNKDKTIKDVKKDANHGKSKLKEEKEEAKQNNHDKLKSRKDTSIEKSKYFDKEKQSISNVKEEKVKIEMNDVVDKDEIHNDKIMKQSEDNQSKMSCGQDMTNQKNTSAPSLMWVDKYKPQSIKSIIGQQGEGSNVKKLINWLTKWYTNRKAKLTKPNPWAKNDDGGYYKAALLSGPPGVAMLSICFKEGVKISPDVMSQIVVSANQDVRQTLHLLSMWSADPNLMQSDNLRREADKLNKDIRMGPWEAIRKVFSEESHRSMSINDKSDLFFSDYSLVPLDAILNPLIADKMEGIEKSLAVLEAYHLLREDLDSLTELSLWPGQRNPNQASALPYAPGAVKKTKHTQHEGDEEAQTYDDDDEEMEHDSDPENDALIKKKKLKHIEKTSSKEKPKQPIKGKKKK